MSTGQRSAGRPRIWSDPRERQREWRRRQTERARLLAALLLAVRNAHLDDQELHRTAQFADDLALLRALVSYYTRRNWNVWPPRGT